MILPALITSLLLGSAQVPDTALAQLVPDSLDGERYGRLADADLTLRFASRDSLVAERVMEYLVALSPLPGLSDTLPASVTTVLAHSPEALDALTGGVVPEWRAGVAIPAQGLIVVPTGEGTRILDPEGRRTLRHEWAHVALHQRLGGLRAPRWFDEGYAQWASGGWDATQAWKLRVLIAMGRSPSLDSLSLRWPRQRADAEVAYLLSASALSFLLAESGERGLALFLERWTRDRSFEHALRNTFGVTSGQFEEDWRRHVKDRYGWVFVLSHSALFWMLLALLLLLMMRTRQSRGREHMARLRAGEIPDEPAFWAERGPPDGPEGPPEGIK